MSKTLERLKTAAEDYRDPYDNVPKIGNQVSSSMDAVDVESEVQSDRAIVNMNKAATLLHHIITILDKKSNAERQLPKLESIKSLEDSIFQMDKIINKLIRKHDFAKDSADAEKGVLSNFGNALENIGRHVTPFLKPFLAAAAQGCSAVNLLFGDYF